jgi:hypothetical protein
MAVEKQHEIEIARMPQDSDAVQEMFKTSAGHGLVPSSPGKAHVMPVSAARSNGLKAVAAAK